MKSIRFSWYVICPTYAHPFMGAASLQSQRTSTTATRKLAQHKTTCTIKALPGQTLTWKNIFNFQPYVILMRLNSFLASSFVYCIVLQNVTISELFLQAKRCTVFSGCFITTSDFKFCSRSLEKNLKQFIINSLSVPLKIHYIGAYIPFKMNLGAINQLLLYGI